MRGNKGLIGAKGNVSTSTASGVFSLIDQQLEKGSSNWPIAGLPSFTISPSVSGISTWDTSIHGALVLSSYGTWTITPIIDFYANVATWGAGGGGATGGGISQTSKGSGGGGGSAIGLVALSAGKSYVIRVGRGGRGANTNIGTYSANNGGGESGTYDGNWGTGSGGGYSGIFVGSETQANSFLIAGGGGGGGLDRNAVADQSGGAGGGTTGQTGWSGGAQSATNRVGGGGTQSAGGNGASGSIGTSVAGSALRGGNNSLGMGSGGGSGYYGGGAGGYNTDIIGGAGGGSGFANTITTVNVTLYTGSKNNPGNNTHTYFSNTVNSGIGGISNTIANAASTFGNDGKFVIIDTKVELTPASLLFDGTGDYLTINSASSFSLTADFTIEFYIRFASFASYSTPFTLASGAAGGENYIQSDTSGGTSFSWGGWGGTNLSAGTGFALNTWYHLALCRSGSTIRSFKDGTQVASGTTSATIPTTGGFIYIGSQNSTQWFFNGYLSNIRVVKGTALYTSNFVRPEVKLSAISGTSLLTGQDENYLKDYSTNNNTINRFGDVTYSTTVKPF